MKHNEELDHSLKKIDEDIVWHKNRQQHVRKQIIDDMNESKSSHIQKRRGKILPVFSVVFMIVIVTIIALSEIYTTDIATDEPIKEQTSGNQHEQGSNTDNSQLDATINSQDDFLTQTEIMEAIKGQMTSDLSLKLPIEIPLPEGKRLTATTSADANSYEVIFYQHDEPIPINNALLFSEDNPAEVVARVHVNRFNTHEEADDVIAHKTFNESMGEPIRLSEGVTGYQDAGTGSVWTSWNVGRWAVTTHASSHNSNDGISLAKEVIAYLNEYMLPAPKQNGYAHLDAQGNDNQIIWQKGPTVYTIDQINDPLQALEMTVNFE